MGVNYTPKLGEYTDLKPFRFWCQKVLPLVYDDSLSYYEVICKCIDYLNITMEDVNTSIDDVRNLHEAYDLLQTYVNDYFDNLDVQEEIDNKLDRLVEDGTIHDIFNDDVTAVINQGVEARNAAIAAIPQNVTNWLNENIEVGTGYVIDKTLTVENAAADAKAAGDAIRDLKSDLDATETLGVIDIINGITWAQGSIGSTGANADSAKHIRIPNFRNDAIDISKYSQISVTCESGYQGMCRFYISDFSYLTTLNFSVGDSLLQIPENAAYVRFVLKKVDDSNIIPSEGVNVNLGGVSKLKNAINDNANNIVAAEDHLTKVENIIVFDVNDDSNIWVNGSINATTGIDSQNEKRIKTKGYISKNVAWVESKEGYEYAIYAYRNDNFIGVFDNNSFITGSVIWIKNRVYLKPLSEYDVRIVIAKSDQSNITYTEGINGVGMFVTTDKTLSKSDVPADSGAVGNYKRAVKINPVIKYMCRDGRVSPNVPPNSPYAIKLTAENEYDIIRFSVTKTTDGQYVAVHDTTINSLARNTNGSAISETIYTAECSLSQLNQYDWGIAYGEKYRGLHVPMLDDCLRLAALYNLKVALDHKWSSTFTDEDAQAITAMLSKYGHYEALIMVATNANKTRFFNINKRYSYSYTGTMETFTNNSEFITSLLTGKNYVYLYLQPALSTPTQDMINFAVANGLDIMVSQVDSVSTLTGFGFDKGVTLFECHHIPNIKEAVNTYAETLF